MSHVISDNITWSILNRLWSFITHRQKYGINHLSHSSWNMTSTISLIPACSQANGMWKYGYILMKYLNLCVQNFSKIRLLWVLVMYIHVLQILANNFFLKITTTDPSDNCVHSVLRTTLLFLADFYYFTIALAKMPFISVQQSF